MTSTISNAWFHGKRRGPVFAVLFTLGYGGAIVLGNLLFFEPQPVAAFWPASGLFLAVLLIAPARGWLLFLGLGFFVSVGMDLQVYDRPLPIALGFSAANCCEAMLGAWLVRKWVGRPIKLSIVKHLLAFVVAAAVAAPMLGAAIGASVVTVTAPGSSFWSVLEVWWAADALGVLAVGPLVLAFAQPRSDAQVPTFARHWLEIAALFILTLGTVQIVLGNGPDSMPFLVHFPYLVFPCLVWAALRFDERYVAIVLFLAALLLIWNADEGRGPVVGLPQSFHEQVLPLQSFLSVAVATTLILSAVVLDRARQETALQRSESWLRDLLEASSDWFWETDAELRITNISPREGKTGMTPWPDDLGKTHWEIAEADPDCDEHWSKHRATCLAHAPFRDFQYRIVDDGGTRRYRRASGLPVFDHKGTFEGYRGTAVDVTAEIEATNRAKQAEQRLLDAIESLTDSFALYDRERNLVLANRAFMTIHKCDPETLKLPIPRRELPWLIAKAGSIPQAIGQEENFVEDGMRLSYAGAGPYEQQLSDGHWILANEYPTSDGGLVVLHADITKIKRTEQALADSERRSRAIVSALDFVRDTISIVDPEGRISYANLAAVEAAGLESPDQILGHRWQDLQRGSDVDIASLDPQRMRAILERTGSWSGHVRWPQPDGGIRDYEQRSGPTPDGGMIHVSTDITEKRQAEEELRGRERELEEAQRIGHIGHWRFFLDSNRFEISNAMYRIFGLDPGAFDPTLANSNDLIHPDDLAGVVAKREQAIGDGRPYSDECRMVRPNGETRIFRSDAYPEFDANGTVVSIFGVSQDITEQKLAERALREREHELSEAQRIGHIGHWRTFVDSGRIELSKQMYRIYGVDPETFEMTLASENSLIHPDDLEQVIAQRGQAALSGQPYSSECRIVCPSGEVRHVVFEGRPELDGSGQVVSFFGTSQDITERRQAEANLQEREHELSEAQRIGHIGHWHWNIETDKVRRSDELRRLIGLDPCAPEPTQEEIDALVHPDDRDRYLTRLDDSTRTGEPVRSDYRCILPNGDTRFFHEESRPRRDKSGKVVSIFGITQDVTDQKHVEEALREREQRLGTFVGALDSAGYGLSLLDRDYCILEVNQAAVHMVGFTRSDELIGHRWIELAEPEDQEHMAKALLQHNLLDRDGFSHVEVRWKKHNSRDLVDVVITAVGAADDRIVAIFTDVTAQRRIERDQNRLEQELQLAQKMEALGQLAGGTAHEINNLLQPILIFTKLVQDESSDRKQHEFLERVLDSARKVKAIVRDILLFTRKGPSDLEELDVNEVLDDAVRFIRDVTMASVDFVLKIPTNEASARINRTELTQVVMNLIQNAIDAMPQQRGSITVSSKTLSLNQIQAARLGLEPGPHVCCAVQDTGLGMTEDIVDRVFEPFFTTKPPGKGTGLGLSVVYGIVKSWNGQIRAQSTPGGGSEFSLYIPLLER